MTTRLGVLATSCGLQTDASLLSTLMIVIDGTVFRRASRVW